MTRRINIFHGLTFFHKVMKTGRSPRGTARFRHPPRQMNRIVERPLRRRGPGSFGSPASTGCFATAHGSFARRHSPMNCVRGEWRIRKEDAEVFIGGRLEAYKAEAMDVVKAFVDGKDSEVDGKLQVCTVLDCYVGNEEALRISEVIMRHMNQDDPTRGRAKFQYYFDNKEKKGRYILWGNPAFVGKVLAAVGEAVR